MNRWLFLACICCVLSSCNSIPGKETVSANSGFSQLLDNYFEDRMKLFPLESTEIGDNRYNDKLPVDFTDTYNDTLKFFFYPLPG